MSHTRPVFRLGCALRDSLSQGYGRSNLRADLLAGCVVGLVALPLSMALAIAVGTPPQHGLYTAIVAGGMCALLGGSRVQVSGPSASVAILAPICVRFGLQGLVLASGLAGVLLLAMGLFRLGRLIQFIPYPVTTGFTLGIGVVIASMQLQDFLGLQGVQGGQDLMWHERMQHMLGTLATVQWGDLAVGTFTLAVLIAWRRVRTWVPAPLVALILGALLALALERFAHVHPATLAGRFGTSAAPSGIPALAPQWLWPWNVPGLEGVARPMSLAFVEELLPSAFAIAMLASIESLLAAAVSDGMTGLRHQPDVELMALGLANITASCFGGFAATGAIARTATNVRAGGRSPIAAITHSAFLLAGVLLLAPLLGHLPMASMAALLLVVAWNMSEVRHVLHLARSSNRSDLAVLCACAVLTIVFDMTIAVTVGVLLAAFLFMRRMVDIAGAELIGPDHVERGRDLPPGMIVFDIAGPLFFGAAHKATSQIFALDRRGVRLVLLNLEDVPVIDATGLVNLRSAVDRLRSAGVRVQICGLKSQPRAALEKSGMLAEKTVELHADFQSAVAAARMSSGGETMPTAPLVDRRSSS